ncbi:zinc-dependent alcohol dehydrogenase family protein [Oceanobacillus sp. CFH 90083]|uniref:zinc-dependent alcohol dehydrogenase family protein n=1 Tax=Oceanobacillus sp. CFH 90083 TaxID=2592336 RepID=UPI00128D405A|nr:zinc-dependent alcohol dehydrogenase family protein [Oceanobacillus sp. CFH 90083]
MRNRFIYCDTFGNPDEVLKIKEQEIDPPEAGEVLVRMLARPINPSDLIPVRGSYAHRISLPYIPGYEGVGIVEGVGANVSAELIGKRVLPLRGEGTWQDFVRAPAKFSVPVPETIDHTNAAQLYINPVTAWVTLTEVLRLQPDSVLLVNACGSAIGQLYAQFARILNLRLIAVTRNSKHTQKLLNYGAFEVVDTSSQPLFEAVMEKTNGKGADAAIDSLGGSAGSDLAGCLRSQGHFLSIGLLSGEQMDWGAFADKVKMNIFHLRHWNRKADQEKWQGTFQQIIKLVEKNELILSSEKAEYELADIKQALNSVADSRTGKVILSSS